MFIDQYKKMIENGIAILESNHDQKFSSLKI